MLTSAVDGPMTIEIDLKVTPTFDAVGPYCTGAAADLFRQPHSTALTGTWTPAIDNTSNNNLYIYPGC